MAHKSSSTETLLRLLGQGKEVSLQQIAAHFSVSVRQARRLVKALREEGIPIREVRQGRTKLFFLDEADRHAMVREVAFTERETLALSVAAEAARATFLSTPLYRPLQRAFNKLLDELSPRIYSFDLEDQPNHWHFGPVGFSPIDAEVFSTLNQAILNYETVHIDYLTAQSGTRSENRPVNPLLIGTPGGSWVVVAFCHQRRALRDFALGGIERITPTGAFFHPPDDFDPDLYFRDRFGALAGEVHTVRLLVEPDRAAYFDRKMYHPTQQIEQREDHRIEVSFEVAGLEAMRSFCQSWGVGITVLEPPELVSRLREEAVLLAQRYTNPPSIPDT